MSAGERSLATTTAGVDRRGIPATAWPSRRASTRWRTLRRSETLSARSPPAAPNTETNPSTARSTAVAGPPPDRRVRTASALSAGSAAIVEAASSMPRSDGVAASPACCSSSAETSANARRIRSSASSASAGDGSSAGTTGGAATTTTGPMPQPRPTPSPCSVSGASGLPTGDSPDAVPGGTLIDQPVRRRGPTRGAPPAGRVPSSHRRRRPASRPRPRRRARAAGSSP